MDSTNTKSALKRILSWWWVYLVALIILFLLFCVRIVGVGQVGIITRFGNVNREVQSGLHLKLPWPIEHIVKMDIQVQKEQQSASAATQDLQTVTTQVALNYHLTPDSVNTVYRTIGTDYKVRIIDPILQETVKSITSQYNATDLIGQRPKIQIQTFQSLQTTLASRGITVDNLSIVNFQFSPEYSTAIEQKQVAAQNVQKEQYNLQAADLQAQAQNVQKASLSDQYLELQAIQKWDGHLPTGVIGGGSGTIFNLPLNK